MGFSLSLILQQLIYFNYRRGDINYTLAFIHRLLAKKVIGFGFTDVLRLGEDAFSHINPFALFDPGQQLLPLL